SLALHGWVYVPSGQSWTNLVLQGFQNYHAESYVGLTIENGKWAIRQRLNNGLPQTVAISNQEATFNTWHHYELMLWNDNTLSVMLNDQRVWTRLSLPLSTSYMFSDSAQAFIVIGVIDFQGTPPFVAYFDDTNAGSISFWSCDGWNSSSCPFT